MDLHPAVVHFPIALVVAAFIFDLIGVVAKDDSFRRAGLYCLLGALFGAIFACITGYQAETTARLVQSAAGRLADHKQAGIINLALIVLLIAGRIVLEARPAMRRRGYALYLMVALLAVINILRAGYLGEELVYLHGAGVQPVIRRMLQIQPPAPKVPKPASAEDSRQPSPH